MDWEKFREWLEGKVQFQFLMFVMSLALLILVDFIRRRRGG